MLELLDIFGFVKVELGAKAGLSMEEVTAGCSTIAEVVVKLVVCVASTLMPGMLGMIAEDIAVATARKIARIERF
jgi:hypothetical protein